MTVTIVAMVSDKLGHAVHAATGMAGGTAIERRWATSAPTLDYRTSQPAHIAVDRDHDGRAVGEIVALERNADDAVFGVAVVHHHDELLAPSQPPIYFSPSLTSRRDGTDIVIESIALTSDPASIGLRPAVVVPGDLRDAGLRARWHNRTPCRAILDRAAAAAQRRRLGAAIVIEDPTAAHPTRFDGGLMIDGRGNPMPTTRHGGRMIRTEDGQVLQLEYGPAGRVISVR
jgi:hypothetical protein